MARLGQQHNIQSLTAELGSYFKGHSLNIAVIDDMPLARQSLKRTLGNVNAKNVHLFQTAETMMSTWKNVEFDIVLCDLNLPGKSGAWLLSEAKKQGLLKPSTIFFIISGETSSKVVNGLVTLAPDEYLVKPYNEVIFYKRLKRHLERRENYESILSALEIGINYKQVVQRTLSKEPNSPIHQANSYRLVGEALNNLKRHNDAQQLFEEAITRFEGSNNEWAHLGAANSLAQGRHYEAALSAYEKLLGSSQLPLRIHAAMSSCYEQCGEIDKALQHAHEVFKEASRDMSAAERVAELARAAGQHGVAEEATYRIIRLTKRQSDDIGKRICEHLLACGNIISTYDAPVYDLSVLKRFQASLTEMRQLKNVKPAELSNSYKAEIQYLLSKNDVTSAISKRDQWFELIAKGKAQAISEAQQYSLDKLFQKHATRCAA